MNFQQTINCALFGPDQDHVMIFGELDFHLKLNSTSLSIFQQLKSTQTIFSACFDSTNENVFIAGENGEIEFLDYKTFTHIGKASRKLKGHVYELFIIPEQDLLISVTSAGQIGIWKARSMTLLQIFSSSKIGKLTSVDYKVMTGEIFIGGFKMVDQEYHGKIYVFKVSQEPIQIQMVDTIDQNFKYIYYIKLDWSQRALYGCGGKGMVFKYDLTTNETEYFEGHWQEVWKLFLMEDKQILLSTGYDQRVIMWDIKNRTQIGFLRTIGKFNHVLQFHVKFQQYFIGDDEGYFQKYDCTQFVSPEYLTRKYTKRNSSNILKEYLDVNEKQVQFQNIKQWLQERSVQELIEMYNTLEDNDIVSKINYGYQIYIKVRHSAQSKSLIDKTVDLMNHVQFIDEFFENSEKIMADFIQRFQQINLKKVPREIDPNKNTNDQNNQQGQEEKDQHLNQLNQQDNLSYRSQSSDGKSVQNSFDSNFLKSVFSKSHTVNQSYAQSQKKFDFKSSSSSSQQKFLNESQQQQTQQSVTLSQWSQKQTKAATLTESIQIDNTPWGNLVSTNQAQKITETLNDSDFLSLSAHSKEKEINTNKNPNDKQDKNFLQNFLNQNQSQFQMNKNNHKNNGGQEEFHTLTKLDQSGSKALCLMKKSART